MEKDFEVIIIGGSFSGLSAAMALGRSLRSVLIIDGEKPCNQNTPHSHNFLTHDGDTPKAILEKAQKGVFQYPNVKYQADFVSESYKINDGFEVKTTSGKTYTSKKLIFATGVKDILPEIDGMADCWAKSVVHCPYCHGYELRNQKTVILGNGDVAIHYAMLVNQLTKDQSIFTNGPADFTEEQFISLKNNGIAVNEGAVTKLEHADGYVNSIVLSDGTRHAVSAIYTRPINKQHSDVPENLGCTLNEMGYIAVDEMQKTSVPGVYAAGDCVTPMRSVSTAVALGTKAGAAVNAELCSEQF
ncbi:MAG: NAD(P)/FAD-dependent oxidoreductase [Bacteroidota bacterium]